MTAATPGRDGLSEAEREGHDYGINSDCTCGRNFATVRGLREHLTKARLASRSEGER